MARPLGRDGSQAKAWATGLLLFLAPLQAWAGPPSPYAYDVGPPPAPGEAQRAPEGARLPKPPAYAERSAPAPAYAGAPFLSVPTTREVLVIFVDFADLAGQPENPGKMMDLIFTSTNPYSMKRYYWENSYGQFTIASAPTLSTAWVRLPGTLASYGADGSKPPDDINADITVSFAGNAIDLASKPPYNVNFSALDKNGDNVIDDAVKNGVQDAAILIVHAAPLNSNATGSERRRGGQEEGGDPNNIWSHHTTITGGQLGGVKRVMTYETVGEESPVGLVSHEFGHGLALPDLYNAETGQSSPVSTWDIMDQGTWNGRVAGFGAGERPALMSTWCKQFLGWSTPVKLTEKLLGARIYGLNLQGIGSPNVQAYEVPTTVPNERFLIEYRKKDGFDVGLSASGVLVWHVDDGAGNLANNRVNVWSSTDGTSHPRLDLEGPLKRVSVLSQSPVNADAVAPSGFKYRPKGSSSWSMASGGAFNLFEQQFTPPESDTYEGVTSALSLFGFSGSGKDFMTVDILKTKVSPAGTEPLVTMIPYPNPSRDGRVTFRYVVSRPLGSPALEVYTLTGDPVATLDAAMRGDLVKDEFYPYEAIWNGRVADGSEAGPGLYLFRAKATDSDKTLRSTVGKFAIIR